MVEIGGTRLDLCSTNTMSIKDHYMKLILFGKKQFKGNTGLSLWGDLGETVSLNWLTSPSFEFGEKLKCVEHIGKFRIWTKVSLKFWKCP